MTAPSAPTPPDGGRVTQRLGCDVCGKPSTWTSTPGAIRFCDRHGTRR